MGRNTDWQINPWGKTMDAQRADLWTLDFKEVVSRFTDSQIWTPGDEFGGADTKVYAQSVRLPEQRVTAEVIRRDSRPYNMPSWDEALGAITLTLVADIGSSGSPRNGFSSEILKLLAAWRAVVRAGRGSMSREDSFLLGAYYSTEASRVKAPMHAFDLPLVLRKGPGAPGSDSHDLASEALEASTTILLVKAWLSSYQLGELSYTSNTPLTVNVTLYAEDLYRVPSTSTPSYFRPLG